MSWYLTKIPKQVHFYWGNEDLPWIRFLALKTFRFYNPDWKIFLHTPLVFVPQTPGTLNFWNEVQELDVIIISSDIETMVGYDSTQCPPNIRNVLRSDLLRWHLLSNEGGLWADMDILFFKPMDQACFNIESNAALEGVILPTPYNNFILSAPNQIIFNDVLNFVLHTSIETLLRDPMTSGPVAFESVLGGRVFENILRVPAETTELSNLVEHSTHKLIMGEHVEPPTESVGVHWHGSGYPGSYSHITPDNFHEQQSIVGRYVQYALRQMESFT